MRSSCLSCVVFSLLAGTVVSGCGGPEPLNSGNFIAPGFHPPGGLVTRIQTGEFYQGTDIVFDAVITGIEYANDSSFNPIGISGLYVSDLLAQAAPYSGIFIDLAITEDPDRYAIGDRLSVTGLYEEYYGGSQIAELEIVKLGTELVPAPVLIADPSTVATEFVGGGSSWAPTTHHGPDGEMYEGVLIVVNDVKIITASLGHGMFGITGGLAIDKQLHYWQGLRTVGTRFSSITGVLIYNFDAFKLAPRSAADFVPAP